MFTGGALQSVATSPHLPSLSLSLFLLQGIAKRLEIPWSLASKWGPACQACVSEADKGQANFKVTFLLQGPYYSSYFVLFCHEARKNGVCFSF